MASAAWATAGRAEAPPAGSPSAAEVDVSRELPLIGLMARAAPLAAADLPAGAYEGWYGVRLRNAGDVALPLRVSAELRQPGRVSAYLKRLAAPPKPIFDVSYPYSPAQTRASQGRVVASDPFVLAVGERATLYFLIDARNQETRRPLILRTELQHDAFMTARAGWHSAYLGGYLLLVGFFLTFSLVLRFRPAALYALYLTALTLLFFHSHGYFHNAFGDAVAWLYFPSIRILQIGVLLAYLTFARAFLRTAEAFPRLHRVISGYLIASAALATAEFLFWAPIFVFIVDAMAALFVVLGGVIASLALRQRVDGAGFFCAGYVLLIIVGLLNWAASLPVAGGLSDVVDRATMVLQTFDAVIFAAAMVRQTVGMRRARDAALTAEVALTREKLALTQSLLETERARETAAGLAEARRARLAEASHDLRQPLTALQLAIPEVAAQAPGVAAKLGVSVGYLRDLLRENLEETRPPDIAAARARLEPAEGLPLSVVFANLERMFAAEAHEKGLDFRVAPTDLRVRAPAITLIRALANLVSNAVKYTDRGGVLIGARRRGDRIAIEVWDTGPGLDPDTLQAVQAPYRRARDDGEGEGLGLAIVARLAAEEGLTLRARTWSGRGSCFSLEGAPRAGAAAAPGR